MYFTTCKREEEFGVLGFWGFGFQSLGFWGFRVWGLGVSEFQSLGFQGFGVSGFQSFRVLGFWGFRVSGFQGLAFFSLGLRTINSNKYKKNAGVRISKYGKIVKSKYWIWG